MTLQAKDRELVRRAIDHHRRQQTSSPPAVEDDPDLELELPVWWARPLMFRQRCWACGSPCRYVLCHAHSWIGGDSDAR